MNYDMVKFERGQVWMVRFKNPEAVGHEQKKDRPWLVLSIGKFNKSSGMVTMVPITTRNEIVSPSQVLFYNDRGVRNVILCENIRTFDYSSGAYIFDFMGNLSDEVLEKVDVAISIHLGLHYSPITLKNLYDSMEAVVKSIGYVEEKVSTPKFTDEDVAKFAEKLKDLASTPISVISVVDKDTINEEEEPTNSFEVNFNEYDGPEKPVQDTSINSNVEVKPARMKWSPEICEEFLRDADTLPMKKVMEKWNILKKTRFYSMKNYAATLLEKTK